MGGRSWDQREDAAHGRQPIPAKGQGPSGKTATIFSPSRKQAVELPSPRRYLLVLTAQTKGTTLACTQSINTN